MTQQTRRTEFGSPVQPGASSRQTIQIFDLGMGLDFDVSPANLQPGSSQSADNWVMREGGLTPRPGASKLGNNPAVGVNIRGGMDVVTSEASHYQVISGTTLWAYLDPSTGSWSNLSWIPGFSGGRPPTPDTSYWAFTQSVRSDGSVVAFAAPTTSGASGGVIQSWVPGTAVFSAVTGNVPARALISFSNYLIAWSTGTFSGNTYIPYPTRVQWSDRGDPLNFVPGSGSLAGFEDILDAKGGGTGAAVLENRVILFTEQEILQGVEVGVPGFAQFLFAKLDASVGCKRPQTIQNVPEGLMFVGGDNYLYLLPKGGGPAQVVDKRLAQVLRNTGSSWAVYNRSEHRYELYTTPDVGSPYSPNPSGMSAEADDLTISQIAGSTSQVSWTNLYFSGSESLEVWLEGNGVWESSPRASLLYNGLPTQVYGLTGLSPLTGYRVGIRARAANGSYTSGYESTDPDNWSPPDPALVNPYSSVFTTLGSPNAPTGLQIVAESVQTYGAKEYSVVTMQWENAIGGVAPATTRVLRTQTGSFADASIVQSAGTSTLTFVDTILRTPWAPALTLTYAVQHVETSGLTSPISNTVAVSNAGGFA